MSDPKRNMYFDNSSFKYPEFDNWNTSNYDLIPCYGLELSLQKGNPWIPTKMDVLSDCPDFFTVIQGDGEEGDLEKCMEWEKLCDAEAEPKLYDNIVFWKPLR